MTLFKKLSDISLSLDKKVSKVLNSRSQQSAPHLGSHILVAGFFGAFNLGDELILETTLEYLKRTHQDAQVTIMLSDNYSSDITRYGSYQFIHYPNTPVELNNIATHYDSVIFPGGAIIDDLDYGLENRPLSIGTTLVNLSLRFITMGKPTVLYGLSSNKELSNPEFIEKLSRVIETSAHFSLRDTNSIGTLRRAGIKTDAVQIVDDVVIANDAVTFKPETTDGTIGLIYVFTEDTFERLTAFTKKLLEATPASVTLEIIPFYDFNNNDAKFGRKLVKAIGDSRLVLNNARIGNFEETVKRLGSKSAVVSMRYHGTLLSNLLGVRTLCIDLDTHPHYFNKNKYLFDHYGFAKNIIAFSKIDKVTTKQISDFTKKTPKRGKIEDIHTTAAKRLLKLLKGNN